MICLVYALSYTYEANHSCLAMCVCVYSVCICVCVCARVYACVCVGYKGAHIDYIIAKQKHLGCKRRGQSEAAVKLSDYTCD